MGRPKKFSREDVLEKVIPLFWKQGFADTSLQDLEQATAVNKSGLYAEFESKDALFLASLCHYLQHSGGRAVLSSDPPGWHNIEAFLLHAGTRRWGQRGCFAVNCLREVAVLPSDALKVVRENRAILRRLIARNIEAEKVNGDVEHIAAMVLTLFVGICLEHNLGLSADSSHKIDVFMRMVRKL